MINYISKQFGFKIEDIDFDGRDYPRYTILDRTRNIFGYIVIDNLSNYSQEDFISLNNKFVSRTKVSVPELERPIFYVLRYGGKDDYVISSEEVQEILSNNSNLVETLQSKENLIPLEDAFAHLKRIIK